MIRSHEKLLQLIRDYAGSIEIDGDEAVAMLAEIDKTLFDLYDTLQRVRVLSAIGALEGCRGCDEALAVIKGEMGD